MFVYPTIKVDVTQRVVATLVACAVVMATIGFYNTAQAANLTNVSNTLTDSAPSVLSGHTFEYTVPAVGTAIAPADTTTIAFPAGFTGVGTVVDGDVTVSVAGTDVSAAATVAGSGQNVTVTGITVAAGEEVVVAIVDTRITNPAKSLPLEEGVGDSYEFTISNANDSGKTRVVIIENVLVTAIVETTFDFVISPVLAGVSVNGESTTIDSSTTTIPFGILAATEPEFIAQRLNVTTNARNGFVVTVMKDGSLQSSSGADIDEFIASDENAGTDTPTAWIDPTNTLGVENSYGHWGMVATDNNLRGAGTNFTATNQFVAVPSAPRAVFAHNEPTDGIFTGGPDATTDDIGQTFVGYKIAIDTLQEAGDDYNTTLTYVATPTF